ncbi:DEAD/DEAH box helicase [Streptomyces sp. P9(2023)]|uniref:DEAD/DEAH box helicase n=1 Tax=Streptomyces sp. P9(2023) TaxID=3064394 RepID=UPI0028F416D1|nr:DEAD/DEAH box helicase [Streptomyces sp. P9(2023)]MDT9689884.1 DEAD/DEAH box helicase [Streptomyces sp. P9(2023)]
MDGEMTMDATVAGLLRQRWGVTLTGTILPRFAEPGWSYDEEVPSACPTCATRLHALRRPYESAGRVYRYVALVCPGCPAAYTLADLGLKTYAQLTAANGRGASDVSSRGGSATTVVVVPAARSPRPAWPGDLPPLGEPEQRALLWCKVTDPAWRPPEDAVAAADDVRVILPAGAAFDPLRDRLTALGLPFRSAAYWVEAEQVGTVGDMGGRTDLVAHPTRTTGATAAPVAGPGAHAARDSFAAQWDALEEPPEAAREGEGGSAAESAAYTPVTELVPSDWAALLPHPTFNPAQSAAVPEVMRDDTHLLVVAPTGAGKTPIGMVAALKAHAAGRKAAWLVPQRSLTDELDRELALWRDHGLSVVRLTGEFAVDAEQIRTADLWVATTEKFESICRAGSLRDALAEVSCLVVDEIHLLGDPSRGALLEALLTRVREDTAGVRIVGLSATAANADAVADWLGARLVRTPWRPTRLTWQLPVLPTADAPDWNARAAVRTQAAVSLTRSVSEDGGSVLVFCGSKRRVRATALALAADRGVPTARVDADDAEAVERLCTKAGVRLHYRDWPFKREAEQAFRSREADVLVATSTVAAGVNLPARAVIVSDTTIGLDRMEVSMVQQMFGRAGRVGAGEREGWAFLLTDETDRSEWQARLAAGYTVTSRLDDRLPDHLLAEAVQGRLSSLADAEEWWGRSFAMHQGHDSVDPVHEAAGFLLTSGHLHGRGEGRWEPTALGKLTSRFMVDTDPAHALAEALRRAPVPESPEDAEDVLAALLSIHLPVLEEAPFTDRARRALLQALRGGGRADAEPVDEPADEEAKPVAGDLARAVLLLVAHSPHLFRGRSGYVLGIPVESMTNVLEEARRYLAWLGAQGPLDAVHPWIGVVASDLAQRIRWRALGPTRGAGRLLWMCERMATPPLAPHLVPRLWRAARDRGITSPDWPGTTPPRDCALPPDQYRALLAERATHTTPDPEAEGCGAVVFTRGDRMASGWLAAYNAIGN